MGTNYYVYRDEANEEIAQPEPLHIGKSSMGWCFSLRVYPEQGINTLYDWIPILVNDCNLIQDEYGRVIQSADLLMIITGRRRSEPNGMTQAQLDQNHAVQGPNNLLRHKPFQDGASKGWPGEGTWDYCNYEFC